MSIWVKICGNTSLEDAQLAANAGADAVGFVLAPSPRNVTVEQVAKITPHLAATVEKIGVFVDAGFEEIALAVGSCAFTGVQLHSEAGPELPMQLRSAFGPGLRILRVAHFGCDAESDAGKLAKDENVDAILVDSRTATAIGGTGVKFDWNRAAGTLFQNEKMLKRMVVAGGLNPENVARAIATLRPWGVDVVSGVEASPGRKDPVKVNEFVAKARASVGLGTFSG